MRREKFLLKAKRLDHSLLQALCIDILILISLLSCVLANKDIYKFTARKTTHVIARCVAASLLNGFIGCAKMVGPQTRDHNSVKSQPIFKKITRKFLSKFGFVKDQIMKGSLLSL